MSQFKFANELNSLLNNIDGPITKGPVARWQKKEMSTSANLSLQKSMSASMNNTGAGTSKTPTRGKCCYLIIVAFGIG